MNAYQPRTDDMQFVLSSVLNAPTQLQALPVFAEVDAQLMQQVLDEAGKFVGEVIAHRPRSHAVRNAECSQPRLDHGARPAARCL